MEQRHSWTSINAVAWHLHRETIQRWWTCLWLIRSSYSFQTKPRIGHAVSCSLHSSIRVWFRLTDHSTRLLMSSCASMPQSPRHRDTAAVSCSLCCWCWLLVLSSLVP